MAVLLADKSREITALLNAAWPSGAGPIPLKLSNHIDARSTRGFLQMNRN